MRFGRGSRTIKLLTAVAVVTVGAATLGLHAHAGDGTSVTVVRESSVSRSVPKTAWPYDLNRSARFVVTIYADRAPRPGESISAGGARLVRRVGAGFVIREDGVILTCEHVIRGAVRLHVEIDGSAPLPGRVLSTDPRCDLALVCVASITMDPAEFGDAAESRAGDPVAVLRASILGDTNTSDQWVEGIIRTLGCSLPDAFGHDENRDYRDLIETTAPIRPGDSGAPLVDKHGRVIGIVTARGWKKNDRQTTGFAIPINSRTRRILDRMLATVPYRPAGSRHTASISSCDRFRWRGALMEPLSPLLLKRSPELPADALRILEVEPDTPAAQAGLQPGDVLVAVEPNEPEAAGRGLGALTEWDGAVRLRLANGAIRSVPPPPPPSDRPSP